MISLMMEDNLLKNNTLQMVWSVHPLMKYSYNGYSVILRNFVENGMRFYRKTPVTCSDIIYLATDGCILHYERNFFHQQMIVFVGLLFRPLKISVLPYLFKVFGSFFADNAGSHKYFS
jgi:hypothetical protein